MIDIKDIKRRADIAEAKKNNGQFDMAILDYDEVIRMCEDDSRLWDDLVVCYVGRAESHLELKDYSSAINDYTAAEDVLRKKFSGNNKQIVDIEMKIARAYFLDANPAEAIARYLEAEKQYEEIYGEYNAHSSECYAHIGNIQAKAGKPDKACSSYERCIELLDGAKIGANLNIVQAKWKCAACYRKCGKSKEEIAKYASAIKDSIAIQDIELIAKAYRHLAEAESYNHNLVDAIEAYKQAVEYYAKSGDNLMIARCYNEIGEIYNSRENTSTNKLTAIEYYNSAKDIFMTFGDKFIEEIKNCYIDIGNICNKLGRNEDAKHNYELFIKLEEETNGASSKAVVTYKMIVADINFKLYKHAPISEEVEIFAGDNKGASMHKKALRMIRGGGAVENTKLQKEGFLLLQKAIDRRIAKTGISSTESIALLYELGVYYNAYKQVDEAKSIFNDMLSILYNYNISESQFKAKAHESLADIESDAGNYATAIEYYISAAYDYIEIMGADNEKVANCYECMANLYKATEQYDVALDMYVGLADILSKIHREDDDNKLIEVDKDIYTLANEQKRYSMAYKYCFESVKLLKAAGEEYEEELYSCYYLLVDLCAKLNRKSEAIKYAKLIIDNSKKVDKKQLAKSYIFIGDDMYARGEMSAAFNNYSKAYDIAGKKKLGVINDEFYIKYHITSGEVKYASSDYGLAILEYKRAIDKADELGDKVKTDISGCYKHIAESYMHIENMQEALAYYARLVKRGAEEFGENDIRYASLNEEIAMSCIKAECFKAACDYLEIAIGEYSKHSENSAINVARCQYYMAECRYELGEYDKSIDAAREVIRINSKQKIDKAHLTLVCSVMAASYTGLGNKTEGLKRSIAAYNLIKDMSDVNIEYKLKVEERLAIAYVDNGAKDNALVHYKNMIDVVNNNGSKIGIDKHIEYLYRYARAYIKLVDLVSAVNILKQVEGLCQKKNGASDIMAAKCYYALSVCYNKMSVSGESNKNYKKAQTICGKIGADMKAISEPFKEE